MWWFIAKQVISDTRAAWGGFHYRFVTWKYLADPHNIIISVSYPAFFKGGPS
jgi:hypothetical protein